MNREEVYALIDGERDYQDKKWNENTTISKGIHSPDEWILYMQSYLAEAAHILAREAATTARAKAMAIVRKVTAMGVRAMEQNETPARNA